MLCGGASCQRLPLQGPGERRHTHTYSHPPTHTSPPQVLERGDRLELLVEKTDTLGQQAFAFKREARRLKQTMWWRNIRVTAVIGLLVLLVLYVLAAVICSPTLHCGS